MGETDLAVIEEALASTGDDPVVYVAEKNHEVVGFIHLHSVEDYYRRLRHGHVADIVVAVSAEGQGIGKRLLAEGEAWARRLGFDWLSISVFEANRRAVTVYEGAGFQRDIMRLIKPLS
jgi:GNAT superfamily N-acetyltransferase